MKSPTIKTQMIEYYFNLTDQDQEKEFRTLRDKVRKMIGRGPIMDPAHFSTGTLPTKCSSQEVEVTTEFLFSNQWNTTDGRRLFDWYAPRVANRAIKVGYYLEITEEMRQLRDTTFACGYCSERYDSPGYCRECHGSENLTRDHLYLLELKALSDTTPRNGTIPPGLEVMWDHAQRQRLKALVPFIMEDAGHEKAKIDRRTVGFTFAAMHGVDPANLIDYGPAAGFHLGWRTVLTTYEAEKAKERLQEFPYRLRLLTEEGEIQLKSEDL